MKPKRGQLVMVDWVDSYRVGDGWKDADDLDVEPPTMRSVGWVFGVTKKVLFIVSHYSPDQFDGEMGIPWGQILRVRKLNGPSAESA